MKTTAKNRELLTIGSIWTTRVTSYTVVGHTRGGQVITIIGGIAITPPLSKPLSQFRIQIWDPDELIAMSVRHSEPRDL